MGAGSAVAHDSGWLSGARGTRLFWRAWRPEGGPPRFVVVVSHGAGEHSGRYEHVGERLVAAGAAVYAPDHRGHGRSGGPRALIERLDDVGFDLDLVVGLAAAAHPDVPVFLLGHSMGATIALRYALVHQDHLAGLVLTGALATTEASAARRAVGRVVAAVLPRAPLIPIDPATLSVDPQVVADYEADALVWHRPLPARTAVELADAIAALPGSVGAITLPALILHGSDDRLCPPAGSVMLGERLGSADREVRTYDGLRHEILNEPRRDEVLGDIVEWLTARAEPRREPGRGS